jgi:hypothetical protein
MEKKFILQQSGIGDTIIFLSYLNQFMPHKEKTFIDFDQTNIRNWRTDTDQYYEFLINLAKFLLPHENIIVEKGISGTKISVDEIMKVYSFTPFQFINLKSKINAIKDDSKIVINTKVRGLHRNQYNTYKNQLFQILKASDKQFILLGEKEIEYGKEYALHGENAIYSAYSDIINNIPKEKLVDMTIPKLGITTPNFENIIKDINIISKHKNICFGSSGIVSLCSCLTDIISLVNTGDNFAMFLDKSEIHLKTGTNFLNNLPKFLT